MDNKKQELYGLRPSSIQKVVRIGSYKDDYHAQSMPVFCKIEYTNGKLSISGVVAPLSNGDARGSCGQMYDSIIENLDAFTFAQGWDKVKAFQFVEYWKAWHLNDLRAGCEHQRALGWDKIRINPSELPDSRSNRDENGILASWVHPEEHKKGVLGKACPVCGYKYGTSWLTEEVPTDVLKWLEALPNTDRTPAWI